MRNFLHTILKSYEVGEDSFWHADALTIWHAVYAVIIIVAIVGAAFALHRASDKTKKRVLDILPLVVIGLYIFDLFVRPISQFEGDFDQNMRNYISKLPFHICTSMGIVSVFAQYSKKMQKFKGPFVILAIVGPLMYLAYPDGVFGDRFPFCYETVQTILFHGVLMAWGVLNITTGQTRVSIKNWYKTLAIQGILFGWGLFGNIVFSDMTNAETWCNSGFDWFFMQTGAFCIAEGELWYAIIAPIGVFTAIYAVAIGVYGCAHLGYFIAGKCKKSKARVEEKVEENAVV